MKTSANGTLLGLWLAGLVATALAQAPAEAPEPVPAEPSAPSASAPETVAASPVPAAPETAAAEPAPAAAESAPPPAADGTTARGEATTAAAAKGPQVKTLSGMSVLGNQEAPTSLVIVPWKSSEMSAGIGVSRALDTTIRPVDRDVFARELRYYEIRESGASEAAE